MKKYLLLLLAVSGFAQTPFSGGIKTSRIDGYVNQDISINSTTGGLLIPRMTTTQKNAIVSPTMFTQVIDVTLGKHQYYNGSVWVDSFGGGSQNIKQTLDNGNTALGVGMELIEDGTDPFNPIGGYIKLTDQFGNYTNIQGGGIGTQELGTFKNTAYSFNGITHTEEFGATNILFETPTDYTGTWVFPNLAAGTDRVAGEQWVIDQGYSTGGGATNLSYTPSPTDGTVNSDTGTDATIPLTDGTNAGLFSPAEKTKLSNQSGTNTGDNTPNSTSQPLDSDLTAIAALTTDSFGRGVLTQTSAANVRTYIGAGTGNGTVTNVTGVSGETTVASGTTTPVIGIASAYTTARDAVANGKVTQTITNGVTATAPSEDAVFDALALKANLASPTFTGTVTIPSAGLSITGSSGNTYFLRADGTQSGLPISNTIQGNAIGTDNGVNAIITNVMSNRQGFWNLQKQVSFLQMLNVVQSVSTYALPVTNNQVYVTHTGTTATYTFPTLANGTAIQYTIINMGSGSVTLNSNAGGSDIYDSGTSSASVTVLAGQTAVIYGNGTKFVIL